MSESREGKNAVFGGAPQQATPYVNNVMRDEFGFEIPIELIPLPSNGLVYPVDNSLHGKEAVQIKAMTAKEEDILTSRALIKQGTVITTLIKSCLTDRSIDPKMMISGDRNALLVGLRVTGYGADYTVEVECPECNEKSKQEFNLTELPIKRLGINPVQPGQNLFEFILPMTKARVLFKYLTGADEEEMTITNARRKKSGFTKDNLITQKLQYSIVQIGEHKEPAKIQAFIANMPARDSRALRNYMDKNEPGLDMKAWMTCPSCNEQSEVGLPLGVSFFWPDAEQ